MTKDELLRRASKQLRRYSQADPMADEIDAALALPVEPTTELARMTRLATLYEKMLDAAGVPIPDDIARVSEPSCAALALPVEPSAAQPYRPTGFVAKIDERFTSGNKVPVERAHITNAEWMSLKHLLAERESLFYIARANIQCMVCKCGKRWGEHPAQPPWWPCMLADEVKP